MPVQVAHNNDGHFYTIDVDLAKEGAEVYDLTTYFKARVADNNVGLRFRWFWQGQVFNTVGKKPRVVGLVGQYSFKKADNGINRELVMSPDASAVAFTGDVNDCGPGGYATYYFPEQMFPQDGMFKGTVGLLDDSGETARYTSVDIWFKVYPQAGGAQMGKACDYYISELDKAIKETEDDLKAGQKEQQQILDEYRQKVTDLINQVNGQVADVQTTLANLRTTILALEAKAENDNLFTQAEAEAFKQTLQETVQNTLDEFQSQFNGPAFQEAQQASLDTNMMYGESLPSYFQDSFNHVTQDIPSGSSVVNIATIADAHWQEEGVTIFDGYTAKSLEHYQWCALSTLYNHADALIALGDNINGDEPTRRLNMTLMHVRAMLQTKYVRTAMFMIRGNHDNGAGHQNTEGKSADEVLDDNAVKNGFGTKFNYYGEVRDGDSFYFYKDFPEKKVRIIGLDSNDIPLEKKDSNGHYAYDTNTAGFRSQQLNWFANKALMLPDNTWQVVVFFHIPFPNAFGQWAEDNTFKNYHHAIAILNAFKNGTSVNINDTSNPDFTITGLQADYGKQGQGTLIAVVNGHLHRDDQDTSILNGTPIIEVTTSASFVSSVVDDSKRRNTNDEDAWDIISINTKERKIHCYRFGRGNDRDFTY